MEEAKEKEEVSKRGSLQQEMYGAGLPVDLFLHLKKLFFNFFKIVFKIFLLLFVF